MGEQQAPRPSIGLPGNAEAIDQRPKKQRTLGLMGGSKGAEWRFGLTPSRAKTDEKKEEQSDWFTL